MTKTLIERTSGAGTPVTWVEQYQGGVRLSDSAKTELRRSTDETFRHIPEPAHIDAPAAVRGAIVGAVQSGKTALMINLAARALDDGFRVILVLAGLRNDLRSQTSLRFITDLLHRGDPVPGSRSTSTHPKGTGSWGERRECWSPFYHHDANDDDAFAHLFSSQLRRGSAVLAVIKKHVASLGAFRRAYEQACSTAALGSLPLFVLDDECDEASVSGDPDAPTPERIVGAWDGIEQYVAYVGFTATPAANLLQDRGGALYPKDFVLSTRVPSDHNSATTFLEPEVDARYTGGWTYYEFLEANGNPNFLVRQAMSDGEFAGVGGQDSELEEALIAYFVSGAIRLLRQEGAQFDDPEKLPEPHTMLAHTELTVEQHWRLCERIMRIVRAQAGNDAAIPRDPRRVRPAHRLDSVDLKKWLNRDESRWRGWYESFDRSLRDLMRIQPDLRHSPLQGWIEVRSALGAVFEHTNLRVVNSDEDAIDLPLQFKATFDGDRVVPPRDIYSIIIGGNRLSRGLTIEGLCISYYTRSPSTLIEDTTVQRERWFGFRGRHLELCRLITHRFLATRLRLFHEHEADLRRQIGANLALGRSPIDATFRFLMIRDSLPTSKSSPVARQLNLEVSGLRLFLDRVQMGEGDLERQAAAANQGSASSLAELVVSSGVLIHAGGGGEVGRLLQSQDVSLVIEMLEGLAYTFHNPDETQGAAWNLSKHHRGPIELLPVTKASLPPSADPLLVAAYLRFWREAFEECVKNPAANRYRAADTVSRWAPTPVPSFNLAVRFGSRQPVNQSPFNFLLSDRKVEAEGAKGRVVGSWGSRGYGSAGDEWVDVDPPHGDPDATRPVGFPGLFLLYVVGRDAKGRSEDGATYAYDRPCFGVSIPEGGPCLRVMQAEPAED